jgi:hypothetical protein
MFWVEQTAGQIMYLPPQLVYGVRHMTNTVSLSWNILDPQAFLRPGGVDKCYQSHDQSAQGKWIITINLSHL